MIFYSRKLKYKLKNFDFIERKSETILEHWNQSNST